MEKKTVLIRADGNPIIGSGHIMRCLSLADAFGERQVKCVFVTSENYMSGTIKERDHDCIVLNSSYNNLDDELPLLERVIKDYLPFAVLVDSYYVTRDYLDAIKKIVNGINGQLAYIDDLALFAYPCDCLINYSVYAEEWKDKYKNFYESNGIYKPDLLIGPRYTPLRREFRYIEKKEVKKDVRNILITAGGTGVEHIAIRLIEEILSRNDIRDYTFNVVVGGMNQDLPQIQSMVKGCEYIKLYVDVSDMSTLMKECDIALSAAGTTVYELCVAQVPTLLYSIVDNQISNSQTFEKLGLARYVGDSRDLGGTFGKKVIDSMVLLASDYNDRVKLCRNMSVILDGYGSSRIVDILLKRIII